MGLNGLTVSFSWLRLVVIVSRAVVVLFRLMTLGTSSVREGMCVVVDRVPSCLQISCLRVVRRLMTMTLLWARVMT